METYTFRKPPLASVVDESLAEISEVIRRSGSVRCDPEEMTATKEAIRARVRSHAMPLFNPEAIASDRTLADNAKESSERLVWLRSKRDVLETRLANAQEETEQMPAPCQSFTPIASTATGLFMLCFAPTIHSAFFAGLDDALLAWVISIVIGAAVGGFLCDRSRCRSASKGRF